MEKRILVALDDSENSFRAAEFVAGTVAPDHNVTLFSVFLDAEDLCRSQGPQISPYFLSYKTLLCSLEEQRKEVLTAAEAEALYLHQLDLPKRLAGHSSEFVVWDVGLGADGNNLEPGPHWHQFQDLLYPSLQNNICIDLYFDGLAVCGGRSANGEQHSHGWIDLAGSRRRDLYSRGHFLRSQENSLHPRCLARFCAGRQYLPLFCGSPVFNPDDVTIPSQNLPTPRFQGCRVSKIGV